MPRLDARRSSGGRCDIDKAARLARLRTFRGTCYWPTWSSSPVDNWTALGRIDLLDRELSFVERMGFNGVRLWSNAYGWEQDPDTYEARLLHALDRCAALGLMVDLVLFDSCGIDPELRSDRSVPLEDALANVRDRDSPLMRRLREDTPGVNIYDASALVHVPECRDAIVAIWEWWTPNPGYYHLGPEERPRWHRYASAVLRTVRDHPALVLVEVMNEPFVTHLGQPEPDLRPIREFYVDLHRLVLQEAPEVPTTIGAENLERFELYEADLDRPLDVVSFHPLTYDPNEFSMRLEEGRRFADRDGRPAFASEWGAFPGTRDEAQLAAFRALLPIALQSRVAWCQSHLIAGYGPFALTALLWANGTLRPAGEYVRTTLLGP